MSVTLQNSLKEIVIRNKVGVFSNIRDRPSRKKDYQCQEQRQTFQPSSDWAQVRASQMMFM